MAARILIIEDDPNTLQLMTYLLRASGHETFSAANGTAGLSLARSERPDLIACDIHLPGLDGFDVARVLANDPDLAEIPLVAVTALAMVGDREKILAAGFDGYLSKPITPELLVSQLDQYLPVALRSGESQGAIPLGPITILIVDDHDVDREYLATLFRYRQYGVIQARDGVEALELLRDNPVDLVISDILMPSMDGYEFVHRLRQSAGTENIPIIFYSASYSELEARGVAQSCGVTTVLIKPSPPDKVLRAVDEALARKTSPIVAPERFDEQHVIVINRKLVETSRELQRKTDHLAALVEMNLKLAAERDPQALLASFAQYARDFVAARQCVVAVHAADGGSLHQVHIRGMGEANARTLEAALLRRGAFADLLVDPRSFRRRSDGNPQSVGLPAEHPAVHSLLVAPIRSPSHAYGWICVTGKVGLDEFSDEDEQLLAAFAAQVGRIYENGNLYADLQRHAATLDEEIRKHRLTEAALRQSEERFRYLFRNTPLPMWVYRMPDLRYLEVNEAAIQIYGYSREEFLSMTPADIRPPEDVDRLHKSIVNPTTGYSHATGWRHRCKDGRLMDVEIYRHDISFEGTPARLAMAMDVTSRREVERQLVQSQKMEAVGQLTGGIAHDFNNILMVMMANTEDLLDGQLSPEVAAHVGNIENAMQRATSLTRQLLAFSRKQALRPQPTNINDLVTAIGALLGRTLGEHIDMRLILVGDVWIVDVDRTQLETALVNLCVNARDAMPAGGRLLIETGNVVLDEDYVMNNPDVTAGSYAMIAVTDSGTGMPQEILDKVFEPFFTTKDVNKGTGLGLSMVYGLVKQSNGHIKIYSEVGKGTSIKLYLPRSEGVQEAPTAAFVASMPRGSERIIVVEDDENVRLAVVQQLQSLGYTVAEASDGTSGLRAFEDAQEPYDLLLTDVVMPGSMMGGSLANEVARRWPGVPVIYMSGYTENAIGHHGRLDPGIRLLSKPFSKRELAQMVRQALDDRGA